MSMYPDYFELQPIRDWPGELSTSRTRAPFKATLATTMKQLRTEVSVLRGSEVTLEIAVLEEQLRLDGRMRAGQTPWHPGVIVAFETKRGRMRYANDRFTRWEDNLRGIVLELEALRGITRWVNNGGQQYGGFLAIEAARPVGTFTTVAEASRFLGDYTGRPVTDMYPPAAALRQAQRLAHPDTGEGGEAWDKVRAAESTLREAGVL